MIIDECLLVSVYSQADPIPPRVKSRAKKPDTLIIQEQVVIQETEQFSAPVHSVEELAMISYMDSMPVMQAAKRHRAPTTMAARPRLARASKPPKEKAPRKKAPSSKRAPRTKPETPARPVRTQVTPLMLIQSINTPDQLMKTRALELVSQVIISEPAIPINTAVRVVMQATLDLKRPYDTNMLASTFNVTRSLVMQSLRKYFEGFVEQSFFTEEDFIPTYLWLYGVVQEDASTRIANAIRKSGAADPGSRSCFSVARDFVILFVSEVIHGTGSGIAGLSSVSTIMNTIKPTPDVPSGFLEMTNSFLYRARMTGRQVLKSKPELFDGNIASLFY